MGNGGRQKTELVLSAGERLTLESLANRCMNAQATAVRARIVLCCVTGDTNCEVAEQLV